LRTHTQKPQDLSRPSREERSIGIKAIIRLELHTNCVVVSAHENEGPLTLLATILIAGFTGTLWFETNKLWRAGERHIATAEKSANAAKRSADALINIERPWMVAAMGDVNIYEIIKDAADGDGVGLDIPIRFVNEGRTTAFLHSFYGEVAVSGHSKPPSGFSSASGNDMQSIGPGKSAIFRIGVGINMDRECATNILDGNEVMWFFGYLEYYDFFREKRTTAFCYEFNIALARITQWGGEKENYMT
jgi:hypothetical protein